MIIEGMQEKGIFSDGFPFRLAINTQDDFEYPVHWHAATELLYVAENSFKINVNNREHILDEGDILFIARGDTHGFSHYHKGKRMFIQFDSSAFNTFGSNDIIKPTLSRTFKITSKDTPFHEKIEEHIIAISKCCSSKELGFEPFLIARIYDILAIVSTLSTVRINQYNDIASTKKVHGLEKLAGAFKFIEKNYMNDISLSDVAKAVGFSEFYFSRIFKDITEKNFSHFLNEYRVKQAEIFLMKGSMLMADIAHTVGFNSIVTFNRAFKSVKGCSPSTYKKIGL